MGSAFHMLCPRYSGPHTPTATLATILQEILTFYHFDQWQLVVRLTEEPGVPDSILGLATYLHFSFKKGI